MVAATRAKINFRVEKDSGVNLEAQVLGEKLTDEIMRRIEDAVTYEAEKVLRMAIRKAPIRKAFYGERASKRFLSKAEFSAVPPAHRSAKLKVAPKRLRVAPSSPQARQYARQVVRSNTMSEGREVVPTFNSRGQPYFHFASGQTDIPTRTKYELKGRDQEKIPGAAAGGVFVVGRTGVGKNASPIIRETVEGAGPGHRTTKHVFHYGGRLRKSIKMNLPDEQHDNVFEIVVRSEAPYSKYVEFPTHRTAAQPFLRPALAASRKTFGQNMKRSLVSRLGGSRLGGGV